MRFVTSLVVMSFSLQAVSCKSRGYNSGATTASVSGNGASDFVPRFVTTVGNQIGNRASLEEKCGSDRGNSARELMCEIWWANAWTGKGSVLHLEGALTMDKRWQDPPMPMTSRTEYKAYPGDPCMLHLELSEVLAMSSIRKGVDTQSGSSFNDTIRDEAYLFEKKNSPIFDKSPTSEVTRFGFFIEYSKDTKKILRFGNRHAETSSDGKESYSWTEWECVNPTKKADAFRKSFAK